MDQTMFWVGVLLIGCLFYGPWQRLCEDIARQKMFEIRDEIFDLAAEGKIQFTDPRYRQIRQSMNSMIRFAHEITWLQLIYLYIIRSRIGDFGERSSRLELAIADIEDEKLRLALRTRMKKVGRIIVQLMVSRSLPLLVLTGVGLMLYALASVVDRMKSTLRDQKQRVYQAAFMIVQSDAEFVEPMTRGQGRRAVC